MRITEKALRNAAFRLNKLLGRPATAFTLGKLAGDPLSANIGHIHVEPSYERLYSVQEMQTRGGGVNVLFSGDNRQCYLFMQGMIAALSLPSRDLMVRLAQRLDEDGPKELADTAGALGGIHIDRAVIPSKRRIAGYLRTAVRRIK